MRLIDADKRLECYKGLDNYHVPVSVVKANIDDMPTVDAVPVVRCKDYAPIIYPICDIDKSNNGYCSLSELERELYSLMMEDLGKYRRIEDECRKTIGHAKEGTSDG